LVRRIIGFVKFSKECVNNDLAYASNITIMYGVTGAFNWLGWIYIYLALRYMSDTEEKINNQQKNTAGDSNAEYVYVIDNQEVWFIDYIVGIAFKTPVDFRTINKYGIGLLESGRSYTELSDIKEFQDYMEEKVGQEIDIESSVDPITNLENDDRRIIFRTYKKVSTAPGKEVIL